MKKIIFDLDNTLIIWKKEYIESLIKTLNKYEVYNYYEEINNLIEEQEKIHNIMKKDVLLEEINNKFNLKLPIKFIDDLLLYQEDLFYIDQEVIDTLKYLKSKYELVVLSNWYRKCQEKRLENAQILCYFSYICGGDEGLIKPNKEAFIRAIKDTPIKDCIVVGDNYQIDIKPAISLGMKVIMIQNNKNNIKKYSFPIINKISELKNIL